MRFAAVLLVVGSLFGSNPSSRELLGNDSPAESAGASEQATVPDVIYIDPVDYVPESLRRPITITIDPMPLDAACRRISDLTGIRFMFDKSSLSDQGISPEEDVEARAHGEPVYLLLDRLFENVAGVQLDWIAAADGLEVLSKDDCEWRRSIKSYPIGDLLDGSSPDDVIEVVRSMTGRHWEHRWKPIDDDDRQIAVFGNTLIVRQSDRCHREIDMLLDALRKPGRERRVGEPALHATLLADLQQKCTLMALGTPLSLAVQQLNSDYGLGIWIDERALNYEGISSDEEVVAIAQQLTIDSALKRMLQNVAGVELDTIAQYGQLRVTTLARADKLPRTVIFDVSDICGQSREQVAALIVALRRVCRGNWRTDEAPVDVMLPVAGQGLIVARCDEAAVLSIREALAELRKQGPPATIEEPASDNSPELVTVYYRMEKGTADRLVRLLPAIVAPGAWQAAVNSAGERVELQAGSPGTIAVTQVGNAADAKAGSPNTGSTTEPRSDDESDSRASPNAKDAVPESGAFLIVRHSPDVHAEVKRHLEVLIHPARRDPPTDGWTFLPRVSKRLIQFQGFGMGELPSEILQDF